MAAAGRSGSRADRSGGAGGATTTGTPGGKNLGPCTRLTCSEKVMIVLASSSVHFVNDRQREVLLSGWPKSSRHPMGKR